MVQYRQLRGAPAGVIGDTQRNQFRRPAYVNDNISLFKLFPMYHERVNMGARFDAFNATNTPAFGLPGATVGSGSFGKITSTLGSGVGNVNGVGRPRVLQASVKFTFRTMTKHWLGSSLRR